MRHRADDTAAAPRRLRRLPWLAAIAAACLALAVAAGRAGREPRLMDRARKVYQWHERPWTGYAVWLTDDRFIASDGGHGMWLHDKRSSADMPVPAGAALAAKHLNSFILTSASPDGTWLLLYDWGDSANAVISLDGRHFWQRPNRARQVYGYWLADGTGWIALTMMGKPSRPAIVLDSLSRGSPLRVLLNPVGLGWQNMKSAPNLRSVVTQASGTSGAQSVVCTWDLLAGRRTHRWIVRLPGSVGEAVVSPQGNRIAWLVWREPPHWRVWLNAHLTRPRVRVNSTQVLLVSRLDGSDMRTVGVYGSEADAQRANNSDMVAGLQWLPSGKALSFSDGTALYTVPAD